MLKVPTLILFISTIAFSTNAQVNFSGIYNNKWGEKLEFDINGVFKKTKNLGFHKGSITGRWFQSDSIVYVNIDSLPNRFIFNFIPNSLFDPRPFKIYLSFDSTLQIANSDFIYLIVINDSIAYRIKSNSEHISSIEVNEDVEVKKIQIFSIFPFINDKLFEITRSDFNIKNCIKSKEIIIPENTNIIQIRSYVSFVDFFRLDELPLAFIIRGDRLIDLLDERIEYILLNTNNTRLHKH